MSLLNWDHDEIAYRVQTGLDRLSVSFFRRHGARVRRDEVDFHGYEHVDLEVAHAGHRLQVRQYARAGEADAAVGPREPFPTEEFVSTFDDAPAHTVPADQLAAWLASLPLGEATAPAHVPAPDPANPFAPPPRAGSTAPLARENNPFLGERTMAPDLANPFAPPAADEQRQHALEWLRSDDA
jgi:hypothetical protein